MMSFIDFTRGATTNIPKYIVGLWEETCKYLDSVLNADNDKDIKIIPYNNGRVTLVFNEAVLIREESIDAFSKALLHFVEGAKISNNHILQKENVETNSNKIFSKASKSSGKKAIITINLKTKKREEFDSIKNARKYLGISNVVISQTAKSNKKYSSKYGYAIVFKEDEDALTESLLKEGLKEYQQQKVRMIVVKDIKSQKVREFEFIKEAASYLKTTGIYLYYHLQSRSDKKLFKDRYYVFRKNNLKAL